jgi:oligopeptide transport system permease protein
VPASVLSFFDNSKLTPHKEFYYSVTAENAMGESLASESIKATTILAIELKDALLIDKNATIGGLITTRAHLLGTDYQGRDMLVRVMVGARISLLIGFMAPFLYVLIGIIYGSIAGFFGGLVDDIMMRITDIVTTVPELLVVIMLQVVMGTGVTTLIAAMVLVAWSRSARQIRGEVLRLREMEFVQASTILGTPFPKVVVRHLLPNVMGTVLVVLTLSIPSAIFTEAFLSFIGLGIEPPMPSWGIVAKEAAQAFESYPLELVIPSLFISSTMLAFNLLGDGLRDALDPKLRGAR